MKREIPNKGSVDGGLGEGWNIVRIPVVVRDNTLKLGCRTMPGLWSGTWMSVDDFTLIKYPYDEEYLSLTQENIEKINVFVKDRYIIVENHEDYMIINTRGEILNKKVKFDIGVYYVIINNKSYPIFVK